MNQNANVCGINPEGRIVRLKNPYSGITYCAFVAELTRALTRRYLFVSWRDHESIGTIVVPHGDIVGVAECDGAVEIEYRNWFCSSNVVTENPAKSFVTRDQFHRVLKNYGTYRDLLLKAGVNPSPEEQTAKRDPFGIRY